MPKKLQNMTTDERRAYYEKVREKERINRRNRIGKLSMDQRVAVIKVHELLDSILDTALDPDRGGIAAVSAHELQELYHAKDALQFQFNLQEAS